MIYQIKKKGNKMETIKFDENPWNHEYLLIELDSVATYVNTSKFIEGVGFIPVIKALSVKELKDIYKQLRRNKVLNKDNSILIWKIIKMMEDDWDHDFNMTKTKLNKLMSEDENFKDLVEETKRIHPW
jgi:hypothetical protein